MKIKSLFISAQDKNAGTLFVSMGMMEILKRNIHRVAFFRPIIFSKTEIDEDISFILKKYNLKISYEDSCGVDIDYAQNMISNNKTDELINELIVKFKRLEKDYDFVLCEGIRRSFLSANINYDLNLYIAQNFASPYINIINAKDRTTMEIFDSIEIEKKNIVNEGCIHFATFVNRLDDDKYDALKNRVNDTSIYFLKEISELSLVTVGDIIYDIDAKSIMLWDYDESRVIKNIKIASLNLDDFLSHIEEGDLIVVGADRSDIVLGLIGALYSSSYPNISAIIFPFSMKPHINIQKLLHGLENFRIPILGVDTDTYITAKNLSQVRSRLRVNNDRKIALSLGLFNSSVNIKAIEEKITSSVSEIMTPMMFEYKLFNMAQNNKKKIVLPESSDERILRAVEIILRRDVAKIVLLGNKEEVKANYMKLGIDLSRAEILDYKDSNFMQEFAKSFYELRKEKGLTLSGAKDAMQHATYFATMMVYSGMADGMVCGATHSTADTIRPALQIIKTRAGVSVVSSVFFMCMKTKVFVYGDCAVNQDPDAQSLADIALASADTAEIFGILPKVAMLSYSTGDSAKGVDVEKVREATKLIKAKRDNLLVEGPIQYDAAMDKKVAKKKLPHSKIAGEATVFIFPDLNSGNNTYKAVQRSSGAVAIGPILQGLNKPINDLSRGCLVSDIVNTIAITAIQAGYTK